MTEYTEERIPVSTRFATANAAGITMYHKLTGFKDCICHSEKLDALLLYKQEKQQLDIFDVISKAPVDTHAMAAEVVDENTGTILFIILRIIAESSWKRSLSNGMELCL